MDHPAETLISAPQKIVKSYHLHLCLDDALAGADHDSVVEPADERRPQVRVDEEELLAGERPAPPAHVAVKVAASPEKNKFSRCVPSTG